MREVQDYCERIDEGTGDTVMPKEQVRLSELPIVDLTIPGYERLYVHFPEWPAWKESNGQCYVLVITNRRNGGEIYEESYLAKERIPENVLNGT